MATIGSMYQRMRLSASETSRTGLSSGAAIWTAFIFSAASSARRSQTDRSSSWPASLARNAATRLVAIPYSSCVAIPCSSSRSARSSAIVSADRPASERAAGSTPAWASIPGRAEPRSAERRLRTIPHKCRSTVLHRSSTSAAWCRAARTLDGSGRPPPRPIPRPAAPPAALSRKSRGFVLATTIFRIGC